MPQMIGWAVYQAIYRHVHIHIHVTHTRVLCASTYVCSPALERN